MGTPGDEKKQLICWRNSTFLDIFSFCEKGADSLVLRLKATHSLQACVNCINRCALYLLIDSRNHRLACMDKFKPSAVAAVKNDSFKLNFDTFVLSRPLLMEMGFSNAITTYGIWMDTSTEMLFGGKGRCSCDIFSMKD